MIKFKHLIEKLKKKFCLHIGCRTTRFTTTDSLTTYVTRCDDCGKQVLPHDPDNTARYCGYLQQQHWIEQIRSNHQNPWLMKQQQEESDENTQL